MNIAYGRLVLVALGAFMAGFGPEFDASWKTQHIPDTASFGLVMKARLVTKVSSIASRLCFKTIRITLNSRSLTGS